MQPDPEVETAREARSYRAATAFAATFGVSLAIVGLAWAAAYLIDRGRGFLSAQTLALFVAALSWPVLIAPWYLRRWPGTTARVVGLAGVATGVGTVFLVDKLISALRCWRGEDCAWFLVPLCSFCPTPDSIVTAAIMASAIAAAVGAIPLFVAELRSARKRRDRGQGSPA